MQTSEDRVYEQWQLTEIIKCVQDPIYFMETYLKIVHPDRGEIPFALYEFQKDYVMAMHENRFVIVKYPRQSGKSTTMIAYIVWYTVFEENKKVAILANKEETAIELIGKFKDMIESLPEWMQPWIDNWSITKIKFRNGCSVKISASSESAVRGLTGNLIYLDEFAFLDDRLAEKFYRSVYPVIIAGNTTKMIITSTPAGMNLFYQMFTNAKTGKNRFKSLEIPWDAVPGRDDKFKEDVISDIGKLAWDQEFECKFLGSQATLVDADILLGMITIAKYPITIADEERFRVYEDAMDWEEMDRLGYMYIVSVDPSMGVRRDASVAHVFLVKSNSDIYQVATYETNDMHPADFANRIKNIAEIYNNAYIIVETNGEAGAITTRVLWSDLHYAKMLKMDRTGGYQSNPKTKKTNCALLKIYIEKGCLKIVDKKTISELSSFVQIGSTYKAEGSNHDDHVTSILPLLAYVNSKKFYGNISNDNFLARNNVFETPNAPVKDSADPMANYYDNKLVKGLPGDIPEDVRRFMENGGRVDIGPAIDNDDFMVSGWGSSNPYDARQVNADMMELRRQSMGNQYNDGMPYVPGMDVNPLFNPFGNGLNNGGIGGMNGLYDHFF